MPQVKYFDAIHAAQSRDAGKQKGVLPAFDLNDMAESGASAKIKAALFNKLIGPIYALSRAFSPIMRVGGFYHVTRDEQVRQVLRQPEIFTVPFGPEMQELAGGVTFALGLDGTAQARQNAIVREIIRPAQDITLITKLTGRFAEALLENSKGRIDVINELFKRTATEVCIRYFGISVDDPDAFADWIIACSTQLFGDPYGDPKIRAAARGGSARLCQLLDDAITRAKYNPLAKTMSVETADTLLDRLVALQRDRHGTDPISDAEIRAILFGVVTGFVPTNTLAAGKMLDELLRRPGAMQDAIKAAQKGVEGLDQLKKILLEAGRFNPAISPGMWRYCANDAAIDVDGKPRKIPAGSLLLVSTMSAMRDKRAIPSPKRFWPDRVDSDGKPVEPDLMFGDGTHHCLGKYLAIEQITEVFVALLRQTGLKPAKGKAGRLQSIGPYPRNLVMTFDTPSSQQTMFLVVMPLNSGISKAQIDTEIACFGNPAGPEMRAVLDATGIVHFSSLATIESDKRIDLVWELSVDGSQESAIKTLTQHSETVLRPIFAQCGLAADVDFVDFLTKHVVKLHGKPWGANGLNYVGTGEFPVAAIEKQARFAKFVERVVTDYLGSEANRGSHAMLALNYVRRIVNQDRILALSATPGQRALMQEAASKDFDAYRLMPDGAALKLSKFKPVTGIQSAIAFVASRDGLVLTVPVVALLALFGWLFGTYDPSPGYIWRFVGTGLRSILAMASVLMGIATAFFLAIRRAEKSDWIDTGQAPLDHIAKIGQMEDAPGYAQNHILAVGEMKPGFLRACAHALALWGIRIIITFNYRPGFVINMGTIHYARWWRVPGTNKTAFYSNFDGSWESYLEDFITRARWGQTAVWSNWKGFPETKYLVFEGAGQGENFKRWVRTKQQIVPFWYSRFPSLTTDQIRSNALIHNGVARARTNSEAEEWLRCFGSMPRVENLIETDEVQALVFSGMKRLQYSTCLALKLPPTPALGEWLSWIRGATQALDVANAPENARTTSGLMGDGVIVPVQGRGGEVEGYALAHSLTLTFGDRPLVGQASIYDFVTAQASLNDTADPNIMGRADAKKAERRAVFLGCSAAGMARFEAPNTTAETLLSGFPPAFRMGMTRRGRNLGDIGAADASRWRWGDNAAEAVLFIYAESPADLGFAVQVHRALVENHGGKVINQLDCAPADATRPEFEHFGYRDGLSQPVIRGTGRATRGVPSRDIVEPGEFILGYKNGQGHFPTSPLLPAEADLARALPILSAADLSRFPDFGDKAIGDAPRDFGRNGSFVVVRELKQDVEGFDAFVTRKAGEIRGTVASEGQMAYRDLYKVIGQYPDKEWVKAKLMGRWTNGRPLIGNPINTPTPLPGDSDEAICRAAETENDFTYGADDPQGVACPFGAHIRRTNPRDSKQPGDEAEQVISNRHRLLRRGRTYVRQGSDGMTEKGILFVSLCADLERQFEFVQQAWANSPNFHGLADEPDPIFGAESPDPVSDCPASRNFTIPTPAGPIKLTGMQSFVSVMAGGYFFLPSRSALTWMTDTALRHGPDY
jgi:Dyp-type peroxidase family